jgi:hypothetical protein
LVILFPEDAQTCLVSILGHRQWISRYSTRCYRKVPGLILFNCLNERWWEGRPRSHFCKPFASVCQVTPRCKQSIVFTWVLYWLRVSCCLWWMAKSSNVSASSFVQSSVNLVLKPLKCFMKLLENSQIAVFEWHSCFKAGRVSVDDDECLERPSTNKMIENVEKTWEFIHEESRQTIHQLADTVGINYGVC